MNFKIETHIKIFTAYVLTLFGIGLHTKDYLKSYYEKGLRGFILRFYPAGQQTEPLKQKVLQLHTASPMAQ